MIFETALMERAPTFRIDEFVLNQFVASEEDLKPANEAVAAFEDLSAVVVLPLWRREASHLQYGSQVA